MKKIIMSVAALSATVALVASEAPKKVEDKALFSGGKVSGEIKAMHILSDYTNGYAPEEGSGYLVNLKYVTPDLWTKGLKAGASFYLNADTGLTDWDDTSTKKANGMFIAPNGSAEIVLGEAYLEYKNSMLNAKIGRQILNTPLTTIKWSLTPNFYEAAVLTVKPMKSLSVTIAHVDAMLMGSRSMADWGLIGEKKGTAGVRGGSIAPRQGQFFNMGTTAGVAETDGITAVNATYKASKNLKVSVWDYFAYDIANMVYADVAYKSAIKKGLNLTLSAQYLTQTEVGSALAGSLDFSMYGVKAKVGNKKWSAFLAYNASGDNGAMANVWGSDPAYTSSLFSRNAYRQDVTAWKFGGHYKIMKGLKVMASHADYGKSKTGVAKDNATETDIILAYKPTKAWTLKIFNAIRTSEYNSPTAEKKMDHYRAVASYKF